MRLSLTVEINALYEEVTWQIDKILTKSFYSKSRVNNETNREWIYRVNNKTHRVLWEDHYQVGCGWLNVY